MSLLANLCNRRNARSVPEGASPLCTLYAFCVGGRDGALRRPRRRAARQATEPNHVGRTPRPIRSARYRAGGDGAARHPYHREMTDACKVQSSLVLLPDGDGRTAKRPSANGFTLIELLLVVAIIGILAALLLPALAMAKASVRGASCRNHLRQTGLALQMYVHENQNKYPFYLGPAGLSYGDATGQGGRAAGLVYWSSKLFPYYPLNWTNSAWQCPGYRGEVMGPHIQGGIDRLGGYAYNTYGARIDDRTNENFGLGPVMFWKDAAGSYVPAVAETKVSVPGEMVAIGDALVKAGTPGGDDVGGCGHLFGGDLVTAPYVLPHGKNYNVLFCDGHVSAMSPGVLFNPSNSAALWNYDHQPHPEL